MADRRRRRRWRAARPRCRLPLIGGLLLLPLAVGPARAQDRAPLLGFDPLALPGPTAPFGTGRLTQGAGPGVWIDRFDTVGLPAGAPPPPGAPRGGWTLTPSLGVQLGATDNVRNSRTNRQADGYVRLNPDLALAADTERVTGRLVYRPLATYNFNTPDQNRVDHVFNGQGLVTLVPDLLFFDARGSGDVRSLFSDTGLTNDSSGRQQRIQGTRYEFSPYLQQRIGGFATARIGYVFRGAADSGRSATRPGDSLPFFSGQSFTANEGYGILSSGENWGPLAWEARTVNTGFDGSGVYNGAYRQIHTLQMRYAVTREIALLGEGGWQDQRFNGTPPFVVHDAIWSTGVRLSPDPDSFLIIRYGRRDGYDSFNGNGNLYVGSRTRVFATYTDQIGTNLLQASDLLTTVVVDEQGNAVDSTTGIPAPIAYRTPFGSTQSSVFRTKRATAGIGQSWSRDTISLLYFNERREPVSITPGNTAFSTRTNSFGLSWTHELTPDIDLRALARLGFTEQQGGRNSTNYVLEAALSQRITPTLSGFVLLRRTSLQEDGSQGQTDQNSIILSLRQVF
ncbi:TIGR03016 family PEP-CTERM system-associated outer membrane protein [Paracraurococcus lichenis]|uniref:TIGR03016 family PEP-CTERM system-associated outer membrane protein n=1 Tax=Paracraurococcus lichenis TaxID=3064888 RepID=A0ABT9E6D6_9PROT|nr:TIGR03016 family PEP-CTERM system-associated outer membrane protein [Paracraurococcus sp. LOR1-02]MDO9711741.1 TIGR03016 family PEP-CTERM system-associated outer membrane protein [Paracraurococcus sp. LOR1-02]